MADEVRPKLAQIPQGRGESTQYAPTKIEEEDEERRNRQKQNVTLPSFREAYGSAIAQYPAPPPPPPPPAPHHMDSRPGPPRMYPESPNGASRHGLPPGPMNGAGEAHYHRLHAPPEPSYRDKDYYGYSYNPYQDRVPPPPPPAGYWPHQMPPSYQPAPPESAPRQRTSIACKYCRKRKIRCSGYQNTPDGKCTNCKKTGNDCVFQPVSSTTSTAFVPVSAIQGGVPPGTPLYGAFGQPLGPNGGRGPTNPPSNGVPSGAPNGHAGMNGAPQTPVYSPTSPAAASYYQHLPPPIDQSGPQQQQQQQPPPQSLPAMSGRQLPLPYPPSASAYPPEDQRRRLSTKRMREDDEGEFSNRLPPPPPGLGSHSSSSAYYDERAHPDLARRSPPSLNGSASAPGSAVSPTSNGQRGYGTPAPPVLPPPPMSSMAADSTSVHSNGSPAGTLMSPTERHYSRSPSDTGEDAASRANAEQRYLQQPQYIARECEPSTGREIDRFMLNRLGNSHSESRSEFRAGQESPQSLHDRP